MRSKGQGQDQGHWDGFFLKSGSICQTEIKMILSPFYTYHLIHFTSSLDWIGLDCAVFYVPHQLFVFLSLLCTSNEVDRLVCLSFTFFHSELEVHILWGT